jgi:hypothetical protein
VTEDRWAQPAPIDDVTLAFPASVTALMPPYSELPKELPRKWVGFQRDWFYKGLKVTGLRAKPGVDLTMALRHLGAIQRSFEPKHEHKEAAVAYLASRWLEDSSTW